MTAARQRLSRWLVLAMICCQVCGTAQAAGFHNAPLPVAGASGAFALVPAAVGGAEETGNTDPFIDRNHVVLGCLFGTALGFVIVNFSPIADWSYYEGWSVGIWAMASRGALGCSFGLLAGVMFSAIRSTARSIGDAWDDAYAAVIDTVDKPFIPEAALAE